MLDEIAAVDELQFEVAVSVGVGEPEVHFRRRLVGAAVEAREGDFRLGLRRGRQADERVRAHADRQQAENPLHWFPPEIATKCPINREMLPRCWRRVNAAACYRRARNQRGVPPQRPKKSPAKGEAGLRWPRYAEDGKHAPEACVGRSKRPAGFGFLPPRLRSSRSTGN